MPACNRDGRPPPVNVQETDNALRPWSFIMMLANPIMPVSPWNIVSFFALLLRWISNDPEKACGINWNQYRILESVTNRLTMYVIVHVCLQLFIVHLLYPIVQAIHMWFIMVSVWPVYLFAYSMAVILYTLWFSMVTVFICSSRGLR